MSSFFIGPARPHELPAAFELAYARAAGDRRRAQVQRALSLVEAGALDPRGIQVARWKGRICGVQVCAPLHGANFLFWLPETQRFGDASAMEDALIQAALDWCKREGGKLAHAVLPPADADRAAALLRNGFIRPTQLHYLAHDLCRLPSLSVSAARFEPFSSATESRFRDALERSYEGTFDCPELNGARTTDEILAGYRSAAPFDPERWWLVMVGDAPAGVVIVTELPEGPSWDLSYLGIVPEYRRQGFARAAACRALHVARAVGVSELILAVDTRNTPARALYQSLGFAENTVRDVYLCFMAGRSP